MHPSSSTDTKEQYRAKMAAELKVWGARVEALKAKAERAGAEARLQILKQVEELKAHETTARTYLAEVEAGATENWGVVKDGVEQAWARLSGSVEAIWSAISPSSVSQR